MVTLGKRTNKLMTFILLFCLIIATFCTSFASNNESFNYTYAGVDSWGDNDGETATGIVNVKDTNDKIYKAYCIDKSIGAKDNVSYSLVNLEDANYYSKENASKIRNIVTNAYPFITLEQLKSLTGIKTLTDKEAIAGAQAAIWHYSNEGSKTDITGEAKALYDWYLILPCKLMSKTTIGDVDINKKVFIENGKYSIEISYKINGKNEDGSAISSEYKLDTSVEERYGANIQQLGEDSNGYKTIRINNLNKNSKFKITISGTQKLAKNVYLYSPQGGSTIAQSLVGLREDTTEISKSMDIDLSSSGYNLTIKKIDAISLNGIGGAQFQISSNKDFMQNVVNIETDSDGTAIVPNLNTGMWYIKEIKAPDGYIPNNEISNVYINEADITINLKNSKYGNAEVIKIDENSSPVCGAKFTLYKGETVTNENIINTELLSDINGKILINDLLPGKYILVETEAPEGYIMNNDFIYFEVEAYKTTTITHVNETVGKCSMNLYKKDAVTKEQLGGTKMGIYSDSEFKNLIKEITTSKDEAVNVSDLTPGTYFVKELKAPDGYLLDSAPKKVELEKNQTAEVVLYNSKNYSTAGNYATFLIVGIGLLTVAGISILIVRKKQHMV